MGQDTVVFVSCVYWRKKYGLPLKLRSLPLSIICNGKKIAGAAYVTYVINWKFYFLSSPSLDFNSLERKEKCRYRWNVTEWECYKIRKQKFEFITWAIGRTFRLDMSQVWYLRCDNMRINMNLQESKKVKILRSSLEIFENVVRKTSDQNLRLHMQELLFRLLLIFILFYIIVFGNFDKIFFRLNSPDYI